MRAIPLRDIRGRASVRLIERRIPVDAAALADPVRPLASLLKASV
jgi:hypothetical protein